MRAVLDSNVGLKWVVEENLSDKARIIRDGYLRDVHELLAPDIFLVEAAHALTRAQRQGRVTPRDVRLFLGDLFTSLPDFHPYAPLLGRAVEISIQARHGVYDCLYVALAEREGCAFLTADDKLVRSLQGTFPFITPLASVP